MEAGGLALPNGEGAGAMVVPPNGDGALALPKGEGAGAALPNASLLLLPML